VPYKEPKIEKIFYSIGEVAKMMDVNTSQIRYWENTFEELTPQKNKKGNRLFTADDIEKVKLIHHLIKERGMTINGVKKKLKENREGTVSNFEIVERLKKIKQLLVDIRDNMEDNGD
jgi:DNA-binding transcriptional MerR regulator